MFVLSSICSPFCSCQLLLQLLKPLSAPSSEAQALGTGSRSHGSIRRCPRGSDTLASLVPSSNAAGLVSLLTHLALILISQVLKILGFACQGNEQANASHIKRLQLCWVSCCAVGLGEMSAACFSAREFAGLQPQGDLHMVGQLPLTA